METRYNLTGDPFFYVMAAFFALLATALPALGGLTRTMPILQALCLTTFVALAIRQRQTGQAAAIAAICFMAQFAVMVFLTWLLIERTEQAIVDGFAERSAILDWLYADASFPGSDAAGLGGRLAEIVGVTLGSLLTAGFVGFWLAARAVNMAAFQTGVLLTTMDAAVYVPAALQSWTLLRIAGSTGLVLLCAEPLLTRNWSPFYYMTQRRRLLSISITLLVLGLLVERILPSLWRSWFIT